MKKFHLILLLIVAGGSWLHGQTNVNTAPKPPTKPTRIDSDRADFDLTGRRAVYRGNVRVDDPQMQLTCEELTVEVPQSGGHIDHLVALTNVVMDSVDDKGQTNHATSDKAVYEYKVVVSVTNETVTLTGNAKVESPKGWMTGEPIVWDRVNNSLHAENQRMILRQNITSVMANTNAPTAATNLPPRMTNSPVGLTNLSPGTIRKTDPAAPQKP